MPRFAVLAAVVAVAVSLQFSGVAAWDCTGHMMTAMVAFEKSSAEVKEALQPLFDYAQHRYWDQSVNAELACWPDDIRSLTSHYSDWHYHDTCYNPTGLECPPSDGKMWIALNRSMVRLGDGTATLAQRTFWLTYLLHLVGDAHQPLHVTTLFDATFPPPVGDLAGNHFVFFYQGEKMKLHHMADSALGEYIAPHTWIHRPVTSNATYWGQMQDSMHRLIAENNVTEAEANDLSQVNWAAEGFHLAVSDIYLNHQLTNGSTVNATWWATVHTMLRRRVVLGGSRLAVLLEKAVAAAKASTPIGPPQGGPEETGSGTKAAVIAISLLAGLAVVGLLIAAFVKRGSAKRWRRGRADLLDDEQPVEPRSAA